MKIDINDLKIESYFKEIPKGSQIVGMQHGVKVTHLPTELVACVRIFNSQNRNLKLAIKMIETGLEVI